MNENATVTDRNGVSLAKGDRVRIHNASSRLAWLLGDIEKIHGPGFGNLVDLYVMGGYGSITEYAADVVKVDRETGMPS